MYALRSLALALALTPALAVADDDRSMLQAAAVHEAELLPRAAALEVDAGEVLRWKGGSFVQLEQSWNGLPVVGGSLRAAYAEDGSLRRFVGAPLRAAPLRAEPTLTLDAARARAEDWARVMHGDGSLWPSRGELAVLAGESPTLVWAVKVSTSEPVSASTVWIDAADGTVLGEQQDLWTAQGQVYASNPGASELEVVTLPDVDDELRNEYAWVESCIDFDEQRWECNEMFSWATPDAFGDFVFDPDPLSSEDPFAEVQMFWHLDLVTRWFEDRFNFRVKSFAGFPTAIQGVVNFNLANAFYGDIDGDNQGEVSFGQGGGVDFSYDADVVYHEFGHAVFGSVVDSGNGRYDSIGRLVAPAGLNEGSADFFSLAITGDPQVGEYAGGGFGSSGAIRDLDADRRCPDDIYGESHVDGEIWGAFGWNLIEDPAIGAEAAAQIVFGALNLWGDEVTYGAAGRSIHESAEVLVEEGYLTEEQSALVYEHLEAVGLEDCGRVIRLDEGAQPAQYTYGGRGGFGEFGSPMPNQYSLDAPVGTTRVTFEVDEWLTNNQGLEYTVYVRRGEPVFFELQTSGGNGWARPVPTEFDAAFEDDGGFRLRIEEGGEVELEPGATYYFAVMSRPSEQMQGFGGAHLEVSGEIEFDPALAAADDDDAALDGQGCADCNADVSGGGGSLLGLLALGLLGMRRRRD